MSLVWWVESVWKCEKFPEKNLKNLKKFPETKNKCRVKQITKTVVLWLRVSLPHRVRSSISQSWSESVGWGVKRRKVVGDSDEEFFRHSYTEETQECGL